MGQRHRGGRSRSASTLRPSTCCSTSRIPSSARRGARRRRGVPRRVEPGRTFGGLRLGRRPRRCRPRIPRASMSGSRRSTSCAGRSGSAVTPEGATRAGGRLRRASRRKDCPVTQPRRSAPDRRTRMTTLPRAPRVPRWRRTGIPPDAGVAGRRSTCPTTRAASACRPRRSRCCESGRGRIEVAPLPERLRRAAQAGARRSAGVKPEQIVTGCGSDDVLDSARAPRSRVRATTLASIAPTFPMPARFAQLNGLRVRETPVGPDGSFDPSALLLGDPAIVYPCSPNNPTGALLDGDAMDRVLAHAGGVVILDEAYAEFAGVSRTAAAPALGRVTRGAHDESKTFGLAGAARRLERRDTRRSCATWNFSRGPYSLNGARRARRGSRRAHATTWTGCARASPSRSRRARRSRQDCVRSGSTRCRRARELRVRAAAGRTGARRACCASAGLRRSRVHANLPDYGDALRIHSAPAAERDRALALLKGRSREGEASSTAARAACTFAHGARAHGRRTCRIRSDMTATDVFDAAGVGAFGPPPRGSPTRKRVPRTLAGGRRASPDLSRHAAAARPPATKARERHPA